MMADEKKILRLLKTARGQMDGIIRMVEENRYCIDISQQLMATEAILNRANKEILSAHLKHCVQEAASEEERSRSIHMKQKFNVTGMTCTACSAPHGMFHAAGAPDLFICSGESPARGTPHPYSGKAANGCAVNSPGIEVLPPAKHSGRATRRGWAEHICPGRPGESR